MNEKAKMAKKVSLYEYGREIINAKDSWLQQDRTWNYLTDEEKDRFISKANLLVMLFDGKADEYTAMRRINDLYIMFLEGVDIYERIRRVDEKTNIV